MYLFIIILVNIFIGVALYLIISLKLERSVSDFRQQRLRKEMDEMLKEFNLAAERNISLLESRINVMRRLLEQSGAFKGLDLVAGDDGVGIQNTENPLPASPEVPQEAKEDISSVTLKQSLQDLKTAVTGGIKVKKKNFIVKLAEKYTGELEKSDKNDDSAALITKNLNDLDFEEKADDQFSDARLSELFSSSDNENDLIVRLVNEGCPWETITRVSGKSAGEIRLILNYLDYASKQ
ncbi:MAG: hypothetical protein FWG92_04005 [Leptospirales bacterium]|nr:hypothetical protein [Leptospirales bacterium]